MMGTITAIKCPNCGASITLPEDGKNMMYCPYCAASLEYDNGDVNINITEHIIKEEHIVDHAKIDEIKQKNSDRKIALVIGSLALIGFVIFYISLTGVDVIRDTSDMFKVKSYIEQGYVCPGKTNQDFAYEDVKVVVEQLKSAGFTNITKVATGAGFAFWEWGEVTEVMIDGRIDFGRHTYFPPDAPIVVTYK